MMALLSFLVAFAGFALMGLSQTDHYRWVYARVPARSLARGLRIAGAIYLAWRQLVGDAPVVASSAHGFEA